MALTQINLKITLESRSPSNVVLAQASATITLFQVTTTPIWKTIMGGFSLEKFIYLNNTAKIDVTDGAACAAWLSRNPQVIQGSTFTPPSPVDSGVTGLVEPVLGITLLGSGNNGFAVAPDLAYTAGSIITGTTPVRGSTTQTNLVNVASNGCAITSGPARWNDQLAGEIVKFLFPGSLFFNLSDT